MAVKDVIVKIYSGGSKTIEDIAKNAETLGHVIIETTPTYVVVQKPLDLKPPHTDLLFEKVLNKKRRKSWT